MASRHFETLSEEEGEMEVERDETDLFSDDR
jgi:hypothetical protein